MNVFCLDLVHFQIQAELHQFSRIKKVVRSCSCYRPSSSATSTLAGLKNTLYLELQPSASANILIIILIILKSEGVKKNDSVAFCFLIISVPSSGVQKFFYHSSHQMLFSSLIFHCQMTARGFRERTDGDFPGLGVALKCFKSFSGLFIYLFIFI